MEATSIPDCRTLVLNDWDNAEKARICRLVYPSTAKEILALTSNGELKVWTWANSPHNKIGLVTTAEEPILGRAMVTLMINEQAINPERAVPCLTLSGEDVVSASGGRVSLFKYKENKKETTFANLEPMCTSIAIDPRKETSRFAIGYPNGSIKIYDYKKSKVECETNGRHLNSVTGLAFSEIFLASADDSWLFFWHIDKLYKQGFMLLEGPVSHIEFIDNQQTLLVVHENHLEIINGQKFQNMIRYPQFAGTRNKIMHATHSSDGALIYVCLEGGRIEFLCAKTFQFKCLIYPTVYLNPYLKGRPYPLTIAAHPTKPYQLSVGLSDGHVIILEPSEGEEWRRSDGEEWGTNDGAGPSDRASQSRYH